MTHVDLSTLTLEQKASLLSGLDFWRTKPIEEAGIPSLLLTDGPHGIRLQAEATDHLGLNASPATCFPPAVAVASSWNPDVAAKIGAAVGQEARALGVAINLGPGVNIKRSPLCGRNFEYYSEDPLLTGVLASAHVQALQAEGPGASVKHFAANNQETDRMRVNAEVDERTLREIYLPAFERVVKEAQPATVMSAYNKLNGVYASENPWLLTEVLRNEWGFEGAVVSDWGAVTNRVAALAAGLDLEMPGRDGRTDAELVQAVREGRLSEEQVDVSVRRVLALTARPAPAAGEIDVEAHHVLAREVAAECAVLLKNDRAALPLQQNRRIAVIGAFATAPRFQGGGSSHINPIRVDSGLEAIEQLAEARGCTVSFAPGYSLDGSGDAAGLRAEAVDAARKAEVTVIFAGLSEREESEGFDRATLDLPALQVQLIKAVAAVSPCTVVVLSNGGVVSLEGWHDDVDAILEGWLLGQAGGGATADLLFGVASPSGRLAESLPFRLQDTPSYLNFPGEQGHVRYGEGVMVGYRAYETIGVPVRYPFGHGLTYTSFEMSDLIVQVTGKDTAGVSVTVTNTGDRAGAQVVQVYVSPASGSVRRPVRELRAFQKVALQAGESRVVTLELDRRAFAYYDVLQHGWAVTPGEHRVQIGENAHVIVAEMAVQLEGDVTQMVLSLDSTMSEWLGHPVIGQMFRQGLLRAVPQADDPETKERLEGLIRMTESMPLRRVLSFLKVPEDTVAPLLALSRGAAPGPVAASS
ncbi:glycoside hydrolase family 3 C-terminal domain-containing protein [Deinococcus alpinitundrae]|uniref:glycoside hydrolase family 3 C-terminal domain-containing protein n=1 Tax=Deinococcus alpinitundrae TaxID=468913 RepID=UPI00137B6148|nr:glycoside hydrolase family 3 C-terminal domain-containing protein [Deinococcus alpinitundrae]